MNDQLKIEVKQLIKETEGYDDALQYVNSIAEDLNIPIEEVIVELKRQMNHEN